MIRLTYVGPVSPVTINFATGRSFLVARGDTLELLQGEADSLGGRPDFVAAVEAADDEDNADCGNPVVSDDDDNAHEER